MNITSWESILRQGDSRELIKNIPDNSVDLILTDPPYNIANIQQETFPC